ncbi:MAG: Gfo/Idh/MocA family oxidoreductase [Alphaproteobacteria bacterium]|nr:MAG: Gfo/Idh/MocA family oxidoreductase [Alphaproteobacteria bacterium]
MAEKLRLGLIGASVRGTWSSRSHLPALQASADVELTAVCTTRADTAEAARQKAALEAGKHVYCEWPLGQTTAEAEELAALAKAKGLATAVGLQARVNPAVMYMREQVTAGSIGEIMAVHVSMIRDGVLTRPSHRTWQRDAALGANTLTIANGHTIDAMRFVAGDFTRLSAVVATQAKQWLDTGSNSWLDVTAPDNVLVSGWLKNGAVASSHVGAVPFAGSGYRMEIYGREGTLVASGADSPQLSEVVLHGAKRDGALVPMPVPERFTVASAGTPSGEAFNVGQMYARFAAAIRAGDSGLPDFATAVELHHLVDAIQRASDTGQEVTFG